MKKSPIFSKEKNNTFDSSTSRSISQSKKDLARSNHFQNSKKLSHRSYRANDGALKHNSYQDLYCISKLPFSEDVKLVIKARSLEEEVPLLTFSSFAIVSTLSSQQLLFEIIDLYLFEKKSTTQADQDSTSNTNCNLKEIDLVININQKECRCYKLLVDLQTKQASLARHQDYKILRVTLNRSISFLNNTLKFNEETYSQTLIVMIDSFVRKNAFMKSGTKNMQKRLHSRNYSEVATGCSNSNARISMNKEEYLEQLNFSKWHSESRKIFLTIDKNLGEAETNESKYIDDKSYQEKYNQQQDVTNISSRSNLNYDIEALKAKNNKLTSEFQLDLTNCNQQTSFEQDFGNKESTFVQENSSKKNIGVGKDSSNRSSVRPSTNTLQNSAKGKKNVLKLKKNSDAGISRLVKNIKNSMHLSANQHTKTQSLCNLQSLIQKENPRMSETIFKDTKTSNDSIEAYNTKNLQEKKIFDHFGYDIDTLNKLEEMENIEEVLSVNLEALQFVPHTIAEDTGSDTKNSNLFIDDALASCNLQSSPTVDNKDLQKHVNSSTNKKKTSSTNKKLVNVSNENLKHVDMINLQNNKNRSICDQFGSKLMVSHDEKSASNNKILNRNQNTKEIKKEYSNNDFSFINKNVDSNTQNSDDKVNDPSTIVFSNDRLNIDSNELQNKHPNFDLSSNSFYEQGHKRHTKFSTEDNYNRNDSKHLLRNSDHNQSSITNPTKHYGRYERATNDTMNKSHSKSKARISRHSSHSKHRTKSDKIETFKVNMNKHILLSPSRICSNFGQDSPPEYLKEAKQMLKNSQIEFENSMEKLRKDISCFNRNSGSPFRLCYHGISGHKISPERSANKSQKQILKDKASRSKKIMDRMKNYNRIKKNSSKYTSQGNNWQNTSEITDVKSNSKSNNTRQMMQKHLNEIVSCNQNQKNSNHKGESISELRIRLSMNHSKNNISKNDITDFSDITKNNVSKISMTNKNGSFDKTKRNRSKDIQKRVNEVDLFDNYYKSVRRTLGRMSSRFKNISQERSISSEKFNKKLSKNLHVKQNSVDCEYNLKKYISQTERNVKDNKSRKLPSESMDIYDSMSINKKTPVTITNNLNVVSQVMSERRNSSKIINLKKRNRAENVKSNMTYINSINELNEKKINRFDSIKTFSDIKPLKIKKSNFDEKPGGLITKIYTQITLKQKDSCSRDLENFVSLHSQIKSPLSKTDLEKDINIKNIIAFGNYQEKSDTALNNPCSGAELDMDSDLTMQIRQKRSTFKNSPDTSKIDITEPVDITNLNTTGNNHMNDFNMLEAKSNTLGNSNTIELNICDVKSNPNTIGSSPIDNLKKLQSNSDTYRNSQMSDLKMLDIKSNSIPNSTQNDIITLDIKSHTHQNSNANDLNMPGLKSPDSKLFELKSISPNSKLEDSHSFNQTKSCRSQNSRFKSISGDLSQPVQMKNVLMNIVENIETNGKKRLKSLGQRKNFMTRNNSKGSIKSRSSSKNSSVFNRKGSFKYDKKFKNNTSSKKLIPFPESSATNTNKNKEKSVISNEANTDNNQTQSKMISKIHTKNVSKINSQCPSTKETSAIQFAQNRKDSMSADEKRLNKSETDKKTVKVEIAAKLEKDSSKITNNSRDNSCKDENNEYDLISLPFIPYLMDPNLGSTNQSNNVVLLKSPTETSSPSLENFQLNYDSSTALVKKSLRKIEVNESIGETCKMGFNNDFRSVIEEDFTENQNTVKKQKPDFFDQNKEERFEQIQEIKLPKIDQIISSPNMESFQKSPNPRSNYLTNTEICSLTTSTNPASPVFQMPEENSVKICKNGNKYTGQVTENSLKQGMGKMVYKNGDVYEGNWSNNKREGFGVYLYSNGDVYSGNWLDSKPSGQGKMVWNDGNFYEGNFSEGIICGHGRMIYKNQNKYEGEFINGIANGYGVFSYNNGDIYRGHVTDGSRDGFGTYEYNNGDMYEGQWICDKKNGEGLYCKTTGESYFGQFYDDRICGKGKYTYQNGDMYEGCFNEEELKHGNGTLHKIDGDKFVGEFKENLRHGLGKIVYANGDIFTGEFSNDIENGKGNMLYKDLGDMFFGTWKNGYRLPYGKLVRVDSTIYDGEFNIDFKYEGYGSIKYPNNDFYVGEWSQGMKSGFGTVKYANGETYEGYFCVDAKHGNGTMTYLNGDIYKGNFTKNKRQSFGEIKYNNGESYIGEWHNDFFGGKGTMVFRNGNRIDGTWCNGLLMDGSSKYSPRNNISRNDQQEKASKSSS